MRKVDFPVVVEQSIALIGLTAHYYEQLERQGDASSFRPGAQASSLHMQLIKYWHEECEKSGTGESMYKLFRRCREVINPVQSSLQNLIRVGNSAITGAVKAVTGEDKEAVAIPVVTPDRLLAAIVRAKEDWAYIETHPHSVHRHH